MFIVNVKLGVSIGLVLLVGLLLANRQRVEQGLGAGRLPWLLLFWAVLRLLPFLAVFVVLGYEPQSDVKHYYYPIASAAATGKVIYRDVYCPYGPFFGYWLAWPLWLWNDGRAVVLALIGYEGLVLWLTYRWLQPDESRAQRLFRALVYLLLPVPFVFGVLSGQEDVLLWVFPLLAGRALSRGQAYRAGLWLALGLLSTKAVFVLLLVPFFLLTTQKVRFVAGLATLGLPTLLYLYAYTDLLFLTQPLEEGTYLKAPNWRSVAAPFLGDGINRLVRVENYVGLLITVGATVLAVRSLRQTDYRRYVPLLYTLIFSLMTVVQHNAISNYAYLFMLPLVFSLPAHTDKRTVGALLAFNVAAAVHPSFWWSIGQPFFYSFGDLNRPVYWLDYALEVFLVVGFGYIAVRAAAALRTAHQPLPNS